MPLHNMASELSADQPMPLLIKYNHQMTAWMDFFSCPPQPRDGQFAARQRGYYHLATE